VPLVSCARICVLVTVLFLDPKGLIDIVIAHKDLQSLTPIGFEVRRRLLFQLAGDVARDLAREEGTGHKRNRGPGTSETEAVSAPWLRPTAASMKLPTIRQHGPFKRK
jgi:hypothetical protein